MKRATNKKKVVPANQLQKELLAMCKEHQIYDVIRELDNISQLPVFLELDRSWYKSELRDITENKGYAVIECGNSLPEQYKLEQFEQTIKANPYQLTLV